MLNIDLNDERLHKRRIPWESLEEDGYEPRQVMLEAQKRRMWTLARRAHYRVQNQKNGG